jgi:hypothetical protein
MNTLITRSTLGATIALTLAACGGSSGGGGGVAGIGGSGFVSSGSVTGFGSVFVNGVEFETSNAEFEIEDVSGGSQADLVEGMRVKVSGVINADGVTGTATKVTFEDQLKGPVSSASFTEDADMENKTFTVLGVVVNINAVTTTFVGSAFDYSLIASGDNVQISGFFDNTGVLQATAVVEKGSFVAGTSIVEAKGTVSGLSANNFTLTVGAATLTVDAGGADLSLLTGGLADGQFVEVKGTITALGGTSISATLVKPEDNHPAQGAEVEIEGFITNFDPASSTFKIDGITVDASSLTTKTPSTLTLGDGIKVEVEGPVSNGVLRARTLKLREGNAKVYAPAVLDINTANTLMMTVSGDNVKVTIDTSTRLDDKAGFETFAQAIAKLDNQFLRVRGIDNGNGILATRVRIRNPDDDVVLQGTVSAKDLANNTLTISGVTVEVDSSTKYKAIDNTPFPGGQTAFFNGIKLGTTLIKIKDKDLTNNNGISDTDGIADEVELQRP